MTRKPYKWLSRKEKYESIVEFLTALGLPIPPYKPTKKEARE